MIRNMNSKGKATIAIVFSVVLICISCMIYFLIVGSANISLPKKIEIRPFDESLVAEMEIGGVHTETFMSTKSYAEGVQILRTYGSYVEFRDKYRNIYPVNPSIQAQAYTRYSHGSIALVVAFDSLTSPANLYASCRYTSEDELAIVMIASEINPKFEYNQELDQCKQVFGVVYVPKEIVDNANSITIFWGES